MVSKTKFLGWAMAGVATAALLGAMPAHAQDETPQSRAAETRRFDVPAQPLAQAALRFSEQAGVQLVFDTPVGEGVSAGAVQGALTIDDAMDRLLAGTGRRWRWLNGRTITIEAATGAEGERVLGAVRVQGTQDGYFGRAGQAAGVNGINGSRDITATEGTGSFTSGALTIGSKSPRAIKDTPQSVSVITNERLEQQNINDFTQALQQAPGVTLAQGNTNLETTFYSRGFAITSIQIDGGAPLTTRFAGSRAAYFPQIDLSQYDHIEVLRGAAGLFNGYGDPSGTINLVRKKPLDHEQVTLDAEWGSWDHYRAVLDATTPLAFDDKLRGRLVLTWQSNEQFYEIVKDQKSLIYGVLDYDLSPSTLLTAGVSHTSQDSTPWYGGLPRYQTGEDLRLSRDTALAFPWNRWSFDTTELFGSIEQRIGRDWIAKLNLTHNKQSSTRKAGYSSGSVNPIDNRGPRLLGVYDDFTSKQFSAEATLSGAFTLFGQRQEVALGLNRSDQDGGGVTSYSPLITSSSAAPYQPYPGGPRYCTTVSVCPVGIATPPIDVFAFNPFDPRYNEPANPLPSIHFNQMGQVQMLAYANMRLTAFDRLHLETGFRWSRFEYKIAQDQFCTTIPTSGTPSLSNCVGRQIGDPYKSFSQFFSGEAVSWPPTVALSYDITDSLVGYLGYADIYRDQSNFIDGDLQSLGPVTGENIEAGLKWAARDGRLNATLSVYRIRKQGFQQQDPAFDNRLKLNPDGSVYFDSEGNYYLIAYDGTELLNGQLGPNLFCCFIQRDDQTQLSEGLDVELTGEVLEGWQVSASYTFSRNEHKGSGYGPTQVGFPFLSIQPEHLYKVWTSYDFGATTHVGWLSNLTLSAGITGQSESYFSGSVCPQDQVGQPNPLTGIAPCLAPQVPYEFTVAPYTVVSGRIDYRLNGTWSAALNLENIFDKTYYQSVSSVSGGNWYGSPRRFTLSLRGQW